MGGQRIIEVVIDFDNKYNVLSNAITVLGMLKSSTRMGSNWQSYVGEHWEELICELLEVREQGKRGNGAAIIKFCHWNTSSNCLAWTGSRATIENLLPQSITIKIQCPPLHPFVDMINQQCPAVTFWWKEDAEVEE